MPETSPEILAALGQDTEPAWDRIRSGATTAVERIQPAQPLFPRVDAPAPA